MDRRTALKALASVGLSASMLELSGKYSNCFDGLREDEKSILDFHEFEIFTDSYFDGFHTKRFIVVPVQFTCHGQRALSIESKVVSRPVFGFPPLSLLVNSVSWCNGKAEAFFRLSDYQHLRGIVNADGTITPFQVFETDDASDICFQPRVTRKED